MFESKELREIVMDLRYLLLGKYKVLFLFDKIYIRIHTMRLK